MIETATNAPLSGEERAHNQLPDDPSAVDETSSLLPGAPSNGDRSYGSADSDSEAQNGHIVEEKQYSNAFIARTVIALLIGKWTDNNY
jgi:hypothetical protein